MTDKPEHLSEAINVEAGLYLDHDGQTHPITQWIDGDGDKCEPSNARACVAGSEGRWFALTLADFSDGATA